MAVLPQFNPENDSSGRTAGLLFSGMNEQQSLMDRAQNRRIQEDQNQRAQAEFVAKLPLISAQAELTQTSANAAIKTATDNTKFEAQAAQEAPALQDEYLKALRLPSFDEQATALSALQPRVAYMAHFPHYEGFVTAVNNATVRAHQSAMTDRALNNKMDVQGAKNEGLAEVAQVRAETAAAAQKAAEAHAKELADVRFQLQQAKVDSAGTQEYNKERGKAQAAIVADVQSRIPQYTATLDQTSRARALIDQDAEQGRGVATVLAIEQAVNSFIPGTFDTAKQEALKQSYAEMALAAAAKMKGQGSITEAERALLSESTAKFGNSPQAAKYIMDFMDATARREIKRAEYYANLEDDGRMVTGKLTSDFYKQNPISKFIQSSISQNSPAIPSTGSSPETPKEPTKILSIRRID